MRTNIYYQDRPDLADEHILVAIKELHNTNTDRHAISVGSEYSPDADLNLCIDTGHVLPKKPPTKLGTAFWCMHSHAETHKLFAKNFGKTFSTDKHYVAAKQFNFWIPNGVGLAGFPCISQESIYDVGFIGQFLDRRPAVLAKIDAVCARLGLSWVAIDTRKGIYREDGTKLREGVGTIRPNWLNKTEFTRALKKNKILVNVTGAPHLHLLNSKIFEALAVGRPILSDMCGQPQLLLPEGTGVMYYTNMQDFADKLQRLAFEKGCYERVVARGKTALNNHTFQKRVFDILHIMQGYVQTWQR